jgi:hypothetical protein
MQSDYDTAPATFMWKAGCEYAPRRNKQLLKVPADSSAGAFSCDSSDYFFEIFHISLHAYTILGLN